MKLLLITCGILYIFLLDCSITTSQNGGGNDFPNPALGRTVANYLSKGDNWSDSVLLPEATSPISVAKTISIPTLPDQSLSKKIASNITIHFDLSDTSKGIVGLYIGVTTDTVIKNDTFIVLYDSSFRDSIKNNENLFMVKSSFLDKRTNITTSYLFIDSDGDSIINNRNGETNRLFVSKIVSENDTVSKIEIEIDGGKDHNLSTKYDMLILQCRLLKISKENDTVAMIEYKNFSGEPILFDLSEADSSLVKMRIVDKDIFHQKTDAEAVFLIFREDSTKNKPVYFHSIKTLNDNKSVQYIVKSTSISDTLIKPYDTALVSINISSLDEEEFDTLRFLIKTNYNPADLNTDSLIGLYYSKSKKTGEEKNIFLSFTPKQPVGKGEKPQEGSFYLKIVYKNEKWIELNGMFTSNNIIAQIVDSDGNSGEIIWDREGNKL